MAALSGDAAARVIATAALGDPDARAASGGGWQPQLLAEALDDPYAAVRFVAWRSLRPFPGFEDLRFDFDAPLSLQARAQAWAFERMLEHHVYWALVGVRWVDGDNFAKGPSHFFDSAPLHLREKMREDAQFRVAENYLLSGLGRHAPEEDVDLAIRSLFALSVQLGDKAFLMGETPCGMDATAFGALAGILTPFFESPLRQRTEQFANLTAYVDRMMLLYYPEFAWSPVQQAA